MCLFNRGTKYLYWLYLYLPLFYMKVYLRVYAVGVTWDIIPPVRGGFCGQVSCSIPVTLGRTRVSPQSEALVKSPVVKKKWNRIRFRETQWSIIGQFQFHSDLIHSVKVSVFFGLSYADIVVENRGVLDKWATVLERNTQLIVSGFPQLLKISLYYTKCVHNLIWYKKNLMFVSDITY